MIFRRIALGSFFLLLMIAGTAQSFSQLKESLPLSQIDIPITINLKPIYALAERNVKKVYTSPNYPNDWVQQDCATRYKYHFRRSPLQMSVNGTTMNLSFIGYYKIIGSTRACVNGVVLSPWSPSCRCGFDEPERRVSIGFTSTFSLLPNYLLKTRITRNEPRALDKCEVCLWGQDVTTSILDGLKSELDASKKAMEDSFSTINLRPYMQRAWNMLSEVYTLPNVGYFSLNPKNLRMQNISASNDLLKVNIGISATPVVHFQKPEGSITSVPNLTSSNNTSGFSIFLEAALQYDSLSNVMNGYLKNKRFELSEGLIKQHIIIQNVVVSGKENGDMQIRLDFIGSFNGQAYFAGKPSYNSTTQTIVVKDLDYDLQTKNLFLKTAKWLFNKQITNEIKKYTQFSLASYYDSASQNLNTWLNKEWMKGIKSSGKINNLSLVSVQALPDHLLLKSNCSGNMNLYISEVDLSF